MISLRRFFSRKEQATKVGVPISDETPKLVQPLSEVKKPVVAEVKKTDDVKKTSAVEAKVPATEVKTPKATEAKKPEVAEVKKAKIEETKKPVVKDVKALAVEDVKKAVAKETPKSVSIDVISSALKSTSKDDAIIAAVQETASEPQKSIWDVEDDLSGESSTPVAVAPSIVTVPTPSSNVGRRRAGRVKTRLLGAEDSNAANTAADLFNEIQKNDSSKTDGSGRAQFPVGWIVITDGPGRGESFALLNGMSQIGRGADQEVQLDFGDTSISRSNHAAIAFDPEERTFFLGHGGKSNLVRLNNKPVLSTEQIATHDLIKIGETTLRFVAFCDADFDWATNDIKEDDDTAIA